MKIEGIEMDYTIRDRVTLTPIAGVADYQTAMGLAAHMADVVVTYTMPSGAMREIGPCEPDHRFSEDCSRCGLRG